MNLEIRSGELVAIQGPSGSGKSTLLYILGCLLNRYEGKVEIGGRDISLLGDEELAQLRNHYIGFIFQQFHLLPKATVLENTLLPGQYPSEKPSNSKADEKAIRLLTALGLETKLSSLPNQLSGGQQQRASIARALLNDTQIILADEPTGALDTKTSQAIMDILKSQNREGRTVIIITHDPEVAKQCDRIVVLRDGEIKEEIRTGGSAVSTSPDVLPKIPKISRADKLARYLKVGSHLLPLAFQSLMQNKTRSLLTMLGIVIGIAAVLSMVTLGTFTKHRMIESYAEMGVNTFVFYGYPNWQLKATDRVSTPFNSFDWETDVQPLKLIFPQIQAVSPMMTSWGNTTVTFGGKTLDSDVRTMGTSEDGLKIANRELVLGTNFSPFHVSFRSGVCVIGFEIYERLFQNTSPIGQIIYVNQRDNSYACRVIGVLASRTSNNEWNKPNLQIYLPYTFYQGISDPWDSRIREVTFQLRPGSDVQQTGDSVKAFFVKRYGKSAKFDVGSDSVLIAQMNKFLNLFTVLLSGIALVSLAVGGIGITNMMLVSVSERFKEIGIRKAFGATNFSIRVQYLVESILLCSIAGLAGLLIGFTLYEGAIYGASKLISKLKFEWVIEWPALLLSVVSILLVGILSGLTPAFRAEKLQVIEALRSE
jgi:macrolide transport system ATP-binding/permease protein